jgi:hypothetical protein
MPNPERVTRTKATGAPTWNARNAAFFTSPTVGARLGPSSPASRGSPTRPTCGSQDGNAHTPCSTNGAGTREPPRSRPEIPPSPGRAGTRTIAQRRTTRSTSRRPETRDQALAGQASPRRCHPRRAASTSSAQAARRVRNTSYGIPPTEYRLRRTQWIRYLIACRALGVAAQHTRRPGCTVADRNGRLTDDLERHRTTPSSRASLGCSASSVEELIHDA